jgi:hypothetical protein
MSTDPRLSVIDAVREKLRASYAIFVDVSARARCRPRGTDPKDLERMVNEAQKEVVRWEAALTTAISYAVEVRALGSGKPDT